MPELPEVETIKRGLDEGLRGVSILEIEVLHPGVLKNQSPEAFRLRLLGDSFIKVERRGKFLLLFLHSGQVILIHLRMTGNLFLSDPDSPRQKHLHLLFRLDNGEDLRLVDQRKFGEVHLIFASQVPEYPPLKKLGVEPFDPSFSPENLFSILKGSKRGIKQLLLDQTKISGIGNIYADEALFCAKIHPSREANSLSFEEARRLFSSIREVLNRSIQAQGRTFSNYLNARGEPGDYQPLVHDAKKEYCPYCGTPIEHRKLFGRGTFYCPKCQK
ncbi:MAG: DNA-formamidopyrimidine glycosylase [Caldiserica bacterium]|jgi:formamidopyrimidine-DNA glycosylase|nr:DNA-formamidopyrimidine glycosylase [Caldisericota bacterium]MDH7563164.1 DNA-formamidopyrimidine glycosylase [Caldisericota bacterium]